jgi:hypothetical protein
MTSGIESNAGCAGVGFEDALVPLTAGVCVDMFASDNEVSIPSVVPTLKNGGCSTDEALPRG